MSLTTQYITERSILDFTNRSEEEQRHALQRVNEPANTFEKSHGYYSHPFELDANSISDSRQFRGLNYKSMLAATTNNSFQNRGSHTLKVAEIADSIASGLNLGLESRAMIRAIVYLHDIGHPPFSHEGEMAFNKKLEPYGLEWDHEYAGLEFATKMAHKAISYEGLNLTIGVLEGATKQYKRFSKEGEYKKLPKEIINIDKDKNTTLNLDKFSPVEGQIVAIADWIAGNAVTDIEDIMREKIFSKDISKEQIRKTFDELANHFPPAKDEWDKIKNGLKEQAKDKARRARTKTSSAQRVQSLMRQFSKNIERCMIEDVINATNDNLTKHEGKIINAEDIRNLDELIISFSPKMRTHMDTLKEYYQEKIYPEIAAKHLDTQKLMETVFDDFFLHSDTHKMQGDWDKYFEKIGKDDTLEEKERKGKQAYLVCQFITSNMSDSDVLWHMRQYHEKSFTELIKKSSPAPRGYYPPPESLGR